MKRIYITFSGAAYDAITDKIVEEGPRLGADEVWVYDDRWLLQTEFYRHNKWLWGFPVDQPTPSPRSARGFGWFCWKPLIILDALSRLQSGDIVLYTDADTYPVADLSVLYDECDRIGGQMMFAAQGQNNRAWCKRDCFVVMAQDTPDYHNMPAGVARFMLFQKGPWKPMQFLMEWLTYCVNPNATSFEPSVILPELPDIGGDQGALHQHRTEQAIMTLLCGKYGLKLYREACAYGNGASEDKELYPQLFCQVGDTGERTLHGSAFRNMDYSGMLRYYSTESIEA